KDLGEKVTDEEKQKAEDAKEALKQALEGEDFEAIKEKKSALEEEVQQLSVKLYEQMAQEQQAEGEGSEASGKMMSLMQIIKRSMTTKIQLMKTNKTIYH